MRSFWTIARLTAYGTAILVIGYTGAPLSSSAYGQEVPVADQKANAPTTSVREAAEQGDADAQFKLGVAYYKGQGVTQDYAEAARWYRKAADQGNANAQCYLGSLYAVGRGVSQDYAETARWYRKAADQGDAECQETLGYMYDSALGVPQDHAEAARWFRKAADQYRKAADQGQADAQYELGMLYDKGEGLPQNYAEAARWYRRAADQGNARAQCSLGVLYYQGKGLRQDYAEAVRWYRKAADQGQANAQYNLGISYCRGKGLPQDYGEGARWIRKAADRGLPDAQNDLGVLYDKGQGVSQDYAEADRWFRKAADQGNARAQDNLSKMNYVGQGVPEDDAEAARRAAKAAAGSALVAAGPKADWRSRAGAPYTTEQLKSFLISAKPPVGLYLRDSLQSFGNIANDLNITNPVLSQTNHTGFSVMLYEPRAWLGAQKARALKEFRTFEAEDVWNDDRLPVLRVIVHPDSPEYLTALGAAGATNAEHVVLRSVDRVQVAQPLSVEPTTEEFWSGLGARTSFAGLVAVFSMGDLERIRSASPGRELFVTIVGERKNSNKDFRVKQKFLAQLGD